MGFLACFSETNKPSIPLYPVLPDGEGREAVGARGTEAASSTQSFSPPHLFFFFFLVSLPLFSSLLHLCSSLSFFFSPLGLFLPLPVSPSPLSGFVSRLLPLSPSPLLSLPLRLHLRVFLSPGPGARRDTRYLRKRVAGPSWVSAMGEPGRKVLGGGLGRPGEARGVRGAGDGDARGERAASSLLRG